MDNTTPMACADCSHEHAAGVACTAEGCNCGADAAPSADAPAE